MSSKKALQGRMKMSRSPRYVNVSALLTSGRYYIDDNGYLVSPNGTRYRLPSGPPEGRTSTNLQKVYTGHTQQQFQLADSAAVVDPPALAVLPLDNLSTIAPHPTQLLTAAGDPIFDLSTIIFTLIAGSVALITNMLLVAVSSYYLCKRPKARSLSLANDFTGDVEFGYVSGSGNQYTKSLQRPLKKINRTTVYQSEPFLSDEATSRFGDNSTLQLTKAPRQPTGLKIFEKRLSVQEETTSSPERDKNEDEESSHASNTDEEDSFDKQHRLRNIRKPLHSPMNATHNQYANSEDGISFSLDDVGDSIGEVSSCQVMGISKFHNHSFLKPANRILQPHKSSNVSGLFPSSLRVTNLQTALSISIHLAFLGLLLSFIHLFVVCTGLLYTPNSSSTLSTGTSILWQLICLLVSSVAMDTLLCVRLHLISCFLCMILLNFVFTSTSTNGGGGVQNSDGGAASQRGRARQQRFACLALSHSLPWALAAGSALFITLRPTEDGGDSEITDVESISTQCFTSNIFFSGLNSILPYENYDATTITANNTSNESPFLTALLLIFIPMVGEFLCCLPFTFCLKQSGQGRTVVRNLRIFTTLLFLLNMSTCVTVGVQALLSPERIPSLLLTRLIMLHLALDPCLLFFIYKQLSQNSSRLPLLPHVPFSLSDSPIHRLSHKPDCPFGDSRSPKMKFDVSSYLSDFYTPSVKQITTSIPMKTHQCGQLVDNCSNALPKSTNSIPKLCQHHQHLLRQHLMSQQQQQQQQKQKISTSVDGEAIFNLDEIQLTNDISPCSTGVPIGMANFPLTPTGKKNSPATAAVMAAAAAAVAANNRQAASLAHQNTSSAMLTSPHFPSDSMEIALCNGLPSSDEHGSVVFQLLRERYHSTDPSCCLTPK